MANDGLILDVDWNISKAEAKQRKLNREFDISKQKAENIKNEIEKLNSSLEDEKNKQKEIRRQIEEQTKKAAELSRQIDRVKNGDATMQEIIDLGNINAAETKLKEMETAIKKNEDAYDKAASAEKKVTAEITKQNLALKKQNAETANIGDQILLNGKKQNKFTQAFSKSAKSADQFGKRLKSLIASALFFSVVTKAFTALRNEFGKLITETGTKTASLVAQLNGSLTILGRTIYESARPYIEWILQALIKMVNVLTQGLAKILGKNVDQMKKLAQQTKKTGKEAKGSLAGFDQVNTLSSGDDSSGTDFGASNDGIDSEIAMLMAVLSAAALVLGVILIFTGANIPLGLGLIAIGAVGLAASIAANWDDMKQKTKDVITGIMGLAGLLFLLLGLVLILTGAGIPLGIGLILLGVTALGVATALSPGDTILEKISNLFTSVRNIVKKFIDWVSVNLLDKLFGEAFGDSLQDLWDSFVYLFEDLISFFVGIFTGDWDKVWKSLVNIVIDLLNMLISNFNQTIQFFLGGGAKIINKFGEIFGQDWNLNANWAKIPKIPRLATGAILPGGSPMLAWVNDQPKGQTYVEGSVDNIVAALEKVMTNKNFSNNQQDNRPIILQVDSREVARANRQGENKLGSQTVFGGFANVY